MTCSHLPVLVMIGVELDIASISKTPWRRKSGILYVAESDLPGLLPGSHGDSSKPLRSAVLHVRYYLCVAQTT